MAAHQSDRIVPVLNIIGPVGIGKSTVAEAISKVFSYEQPIPHAIVDLDDFRRAYPAPESDPFNMALGFRNLADVWQNYKQAGARCVIIPNVVEGQEHIDEIRRAIPGADILIVRLIAPLEVNHARIRGRETDTALLDWHLKRSEQLSRELAEKQLEHFTVDTDGKSPQEIAREIVDCWAAARLITKK